MVVDYAVAVDADRSLHAALALPASAWRETTTTTSISATSQPHWFRVTLQNAGNSVLERHLEIAYPVLDYIMSMPSPKPAPTSTGNWATIPVRGAQLLVPQLHRAAAPGAERKAAAVFPCADLQRAAAAADAVGSRRPATPTISAKACCSACTSAA